MTDPVENASSSKSGKASKKDTWEVLESISKIIAALGIPVVLGVGGWIIQGTVSQQTVSKDYVLLATDILKTKREAGEDGGRVCGAESAFGKRADAGGGFVRVAEGGIGGGDARGRAGLGERAEWNGEAV